MPSPRAASFNRLSALYRASADDRARPVSSPASQSLPSSTGSLVRSVQVVVGENQPFRRGDDAVRSAHRGRRAGLVVEAPRVESRRGYAARKITTSGCHHVVLIFASSRWTLGPSTARNMCGQRPHAGSRSRSRPTGRDSTTRRVTRRSRPAVTIDSACPLTAAGHAEIPAVPLRQRCRNRWRAASRRRPGDSSSARANPARTG